MWRGRETAVEHIFMLLSWPKAAEYITDIFGSRFLNPLELPKIIYQPTIIRKIQSIMIELHYISNNILLYIQTKIFKATHRGDLPETGSYVVLMEICMTRGFTKTVLFRGTTEY